MIEIRQTEVFANWFRIWVTVKQGRTSKSELTDCNLVCLGT